MARKALKQPIGSKTSFARNTIKERPHFDTDCNIFAEEHYNSYLIVKNTAKADKNRLYNRLYLDSKKELDFFLATGYGPRGVSENNHKVTNAHILSLLSQHSNLINKYISKIKRDEKRRYVRDLMYGLNNILNLFDNAKIYVPNDPLEFTADIHQKHLQETILNMNLGYEFVKNIGTAWAFIRTAFDLTILDTLPITTSTQKQIEALVIDDNIGRKTEKEGSDDEITLEMLFQLDYYSQMELDRVIGLAEEYMQWIKDLKEQGELFSQANLLKSYFNNIAWQTPRKLHILLYQEDPQVWDPYQNKKYLNKEAEQRHQELILIAQVGIDLKITDEKMMAWWHKTLYPKWPFDREIAKPYCEIFTNNRTWRDHAAKKAGISLIDFNQRIMPNIHSIYPLFLRLLIDSQANTETVYNTEIYRKPNGTYCMGVIHNRLRMLNSPKYKSNTITPAYITKGTFTDRCISFYTKWLTPLYEYSQNKSFVQYMHGSKIITLNSDNLKRLNSEASFRKNLDDLKVLFFSRYKIYKTVDIYIVDNNGKNITLTAKKRVPWIKHKNIRAATNYKNYHLEFGDWVRKHVNLGHISEQIEPKHYQQYSWKAENEHQVATTLLHIQHFIEKKISDDRLEVAFKQPHCDCEDNTKPDFDGAPEINDGEICTSWRNCLTKCNQSRIFPKVHGPTNVAWKILIEQERENFLLTKDWAKEYALDYEAVNTVINLLKPKDLAFAKEKAAERMPFVRLMMMQTKQKRKINQMKIKERHA